LLECPCIIFCVCVSFFFSEVSHTMANFLFNIANFLP
jgi:hypothetical protein